MDFKEKDSILTFLTREVGKRAGVLHGGKSMRSGNAAKAELFVLNHFEFSEKPNTELVRIRKCELMESYPFLRQNYSKFLSRNGLIILHDIKSNLVKGVPKLWNEIKSKEKKNWLFKEIFDSGQMMECGLGILSKKNDS